MCTINDTTTHPPRRNKETRTLVFTGCKDDWLRLLRERLDRGCNVLVGAGSRAVCIKLHDEYTKAGFRCRIYTGAPEHKGHLEDFRYNSDGSGGVDVAWTPPLQRSIQMLGMNAACTIAVSNQTWRCDYVMLHHDQRTMPAKDYLQLAYRAGRCGIGDGPGQLRCPRVIVFVGGANNSDSVDLDETRSVMRQMADSIGLTNRIQDQMVNNSRKRGTTDEARKPLNRPRWFGPVQANVQVRSRQSQIRILNYLLKKIKYYCRVT